MIIIYEGKKRTVNKEYKTISHALLALGINPNTVIAKINSQLVPVESKPKKNSKIELISVVSGG